MFIIFNVLSCLVWFTNKVLILANAKYLFLQMSSIYSCQCQVLFLQMSSTYSCQCQVLILANVNYLFLPVSRVYPFTFCQKKFIAENVQLIALHIIEASERWRYNNCLVSLERAKEQKHPTHRGTAECTFPTQLSLSFLGRNVFEKNV